jgi:hypothetical protein
MRKIVNNVIVFDDAVKCDKCGTLGAYDCTSTFLCGNCMPKASPIALQGLVVCPRCGKNEWKPIPDSLAEYCPCGEVRVESDNGTYSRGASLQEWAADLAKIRTDNAESSHAGAEAPEKH